jgi:hypothetical protein
VKPALPRLALVCTLLGASFATPASAKETVSPEVQKLVHDMMVDYNTGDFDAALKKATEAYRLQPLPALLFNIGQFHKQLHHWERAAFFFHRYLVERPDAPNREEVERLIDDVAQKQGQEPAPAPAPVSTTAPAQAQAASRAPSPAAATPSAPAPAAKPAPTEAVSAPEATVTVTVESPSRSHWFAWSLIGGAVLLGVGAGLASIPVENMAQLNQQVNSGSGQLAYSKVQSADSQGATFQGVAIGLGVAAILCGGGAAFAW